MKEKSVIATALLLFSSVTVAEVVKGRICIDSFPGTEECVEIYERSKTNSLIDVLIAIDKTRVDQKRKIYSSAVVELQTLPDFQVVGRTKVSADGEYVINAKEDNRDWRVCCRCEIEDDGEMYVFSGASHVVWNKKERAYVQKLWLLRETTSLVGRCLDKNGNSVVGAVVKVDMITSEPTDTDEGQWPQQIARTDKDGCWRVDGLPTPTLNHQIAYLCNTNIIYRYDSARPPYRISIQVHPMYISEPIGRASVANVTANSRKAAERFMLAYRRKTGVDIPKIAPLADLPISTNNVIYVPDMILK